MNTENDMKYETSADFFRDTAANHGTEEAFAIGGRYLDTQLKLEQSGEERQFCRELFSAMCETAADRATPTKIVYPYDFQKADERLESSYYHESRNRNTECARAIDEAIRASCYKPNFYNLELAAMKVANDFGFTRVNLVLAFNLQKGEHDGRFSPSNKQWAQEFAISEPSFGRTYLQAHPILIESFTDYTRKLYDNIDADRFALPGRAESGELVQGYEIVRAITFDDRRGFAIGLNPEAVSQFVSWQFTVEDGKRDYYWGDYSNELSGAAENYAARILVHMSGSDVREIQNPLLPAELSREQNYNMLDGLRNNEAPARADLTDGQTHEELLELAPKDLPAAEKPSVLGQLRDAREVPQTPTKNKKSPDLEL